MNVMTGRDLGIGDTGENRWDKPLVGRPDENSPSDKRKLDQNIIDSYTSIMAILDQAKDSKALSSLKELLQRDYQLVQKPDGTNQQRGATMMMISIKNNEEAHAKEGLEPSQATALEGEIENYLDLTRRFLDKQLSTDFDQSIHAIAAQTGAQKLKRFLAEIKTDQVLELAKNLSEAIQDNNYQIDGLKKGLINDEDASKISKLVSDITKLTPIATGLRRGEGRDDFLTAMKLQRLFLLILTYKELSQESDIQVEPARKVIQNQIIDLSIIRHRQDSDPDFGPNQLKAYIEATDPMTIWESLDPEASMENKLSLALTALGISLKKIDL